MINLFDKVFNQKKKKKKNIDLKLSEIFNTVISLSFVKSAFIIFVI